MFGVSSSLRTIPFVSLSFPKPLSVNSGLGREFADKKESNTMNFHVEQLSLHDEFADLIQERKTAAPGNQQNSLFENPI